MEHLYEDQTIFRSLEKNEYPYYIPTDQMVEDVTPWRQSMRYILLGWLLYNLAIDTSVMFQLLPVVGVVLLYLGFRSLKKENRWFMAGLGLSLGLAVWALTCFAVSCTIWQSGFFSSTAVVVLNCVFRGFAFAVLLCLRQGVCQVQKRAGLDPDTKHVTIALGLYVPLCVLLLLGNAGTLIALWLVLAVALAWCLSKAHKHIGEAGYSICPAPVKLRKLYIWLIAIGIILLCAVIGALFFQQYPMQWEDADRPFSAEAEASRQNLAALGMPAQVLADLSEEDLLALQSADQVVPSEYNEVTLFLPRKWPKETNVAVHLPGGWKTIWHFQWTTSPFYRGTECLKISNTPFVYAKIATGQVLYDDGGTAQASPYYFLNSMAYYRLVYNSQVAMGITSPYREEDALLAAFSFPLNAENCRGYLMFDSHDQQGPSYCSPLYYCQTVPMFSHKVQDVLEYETSGPSISYGDPYFSGRWDSLPQ